MPFRVEEATIDELHRAIKAGETTCVAVVEQYLARAPQADPVVAGAAGQADAGPGSDRFVFDP